MAKTKISSNSQNKSVDAVDEVSSPTRRIIDSARETIKRTRKTLSSSTDEPEIKEKIKAQELLEELEKLYSPENFIHLVRSPSDLMVMMTGRDHIWKISDNEAKAMATSASTTAKYFMRTDPKYVALSMLIMSTLTIYGTRMALHYKEIIKEKKGSNAT